MRSSVRAAALAIGDGVATVGRGARSAPTTSGRSCRPPPQFRFVGRRRRRSRCADTPWFQVFDDPDAAGAASESAIGSNLDLRVAVGACRGGARARRHREVVPLSAGRRRRQLQRAPGVERTEETDDEDTTHQSTQLRVPLVVGTRPVRQAPAPARSGVGAGARERAGAPRRARHAHRRRGDRTTSCCASSTCSSPSRDETLRLNDETVTYFQNRLDGGVSNRLELDRIRRNPRADRRRDSRKSSSRSRMVENELSLLLGRPPGPIAREPLRPDEALPPAVPPAFPRRCSSGGRMCCRRSSCSSRPTPISAPPRRCSSRPSA